MVICRMQQREFFVILDRFLPFYPPNNPKNQNFKKLKKTSGYIIILNMCTINDIHIWFLRHQAQRIHFFVIMDHFLPFYLPNNHKIKILKKLKKHLEILSFHTCIPWQSYDIWFLRYGAWPTELFVILDHFFVLLPL